MSIHSMFVSNEILFIFYKNLVYKNIKASNHSKIKNIVVISYLLSLLKASAKK